MIAEILQFNCSFKGLNGSLGFILFLYIIKMVAIEASSLRSPRCWMTILRCFVRKMLKEKDYMWDPILPT